MIHWLQHTTGGLLVLAAVSIAVLLALIIRLKVEPFIALIVVGLLTALAAGLPVGTIVGTAQKTSDSLLEKGFGSILGHITAIIGLGTLLGSILERSGGARVLTGALLRAFGEKRAPLAMGLAGLIFGIPVFFDIGIFVLAPLVYVAARQGGRSILLYCLPLLAGLSMTHAFIPPHPGPVAAAGLLHVDLGWIILMGAVCGIPAWFVSGVLFPTWIGKRMNRPVPAEMIVVDEEEDEHPPSLGLVTGIIAVPLVLILAGTFGSIWLPKDSTLAGIAAFVGTPAVALTITVLLASWLLGYRRGMTGKHLSELAAASLRPVAMLLLVVGAGAFFGAVLSATGIGKAVADSLHDAGLPVIFAAYVISCGLRVAQGSATVAIVTTSGIIAPTVTELHYSQVQLALLVVAISAGSIIASHVNDGGFWIVSRYFGLSVSDTLKTWTVLETLLSVTGFAVAAVLMALV
ncbi:GntP family gluconate:H+ symporter [Amycolatopsis bartoniae]|uniref:Gluconate:H+ symporter, GntP family protein n=1 Tax=Amycolatopsis bartoniae TaxID=941986 RepID=A0A8H9MGZ8_9PSEU|nr:gluconate:H+ symporter [Amycolatopsis bartoniae]MBB2936350.1 GntP family gluconate:H+ symporter [Amycolatopsis bartoniae]TVS99726.1 GntP family permease [Amycolatopsis bartoniae]GHF85132.1 gluconate:H+ symporter, GntP family protein [Amycolatopsis bartoniae]